MDNESTALQTIENVELDLPTWDRKGDMTTAFAQHLEPRWRIAQMLAKSGMTREKRPEAIMAIQLKAYEMGLPLMQALSGMYFVDGKIALEGHLMDALAIERCGVRKTIHESTRQQCRMTLHRAGWDSTDVAFTLEDAKTAGLIRDYDETGKINPAVSRSGKPQTTWVKHTEEMLYWRALSKGLKRIAPDYFGGVYTLDELADAAEQHVTASQTSTNAELDALEKGVDADPAAMGPEEIEQMREELERAKKDGVIDGERETELLTAAIEGRWDEAHEGWEDVRRAVLEAKAAP